MSPGNADHERRGRGMERENFQSRSGQAVKAFGDQRDAASGFNRCDETGDAVVFLHDLRRPAQWREQIRQPRVMFGVIRESKGDQTLPGDLFQTDFSRAGQWVGRMDRHTNGVTPQFLENKFSPNLGRHLNQQGHMDFSVAQPAQHLLRGQIVKLHADSGHGCLEEF